MIHLQKPLLTLGLAALLALAWDAWNLERTHGLNAALQSTQPPVGPLAEQRFAEARQLDANGQWQAALGRYQALATEAGSPVAADARYNAANVYLREGRRALDAEGPAAATPLLELAKQAYRDVLARDPAYWNARYNLERTLRLAPEEADAASAVAPEPLQSERAVTTMRGFTLGLP